MLHDKEDLLDELNCLEDSVLQNVKGLIDNKFSEFDYIISSANLKDTFKNLDFVFTGGFGLREFYIIVNDVNYTIQIEENEIEVVETIEF